MFYSQERRKEKREKREKEETLRAKREGKRKEKREKREKEKKKRERRMEAIHIAAQKGERERVSNILISSPQHSNLPDIQQWRPLHFAVLNRHLDVVTLLLEYGAELDATNDVGWTALHIAARNGWDSGGALLIGRKANLTPIDRFGREPEAYARSKGNDSFLKMLVDAKEKPIITTAFTSTPTSSKSPFQIHVHYQDVSDLIQDPTVSIDVAFSSENNHLDMSQTPGSMSYYFNTQGGTIQKELSGKYPRLPVEVTATTGKVAFTSAGNLSEKYHLKGVIHLIVVKRHPIFGWDTNSATPENVKDVFCKALHLANEKGFTSVVMRFPFTAKAKEGASGISKLTEAMESVLEDHDMVRQWPCQRLRQVHLCCQDQKK
mmetsp:Transcript_7093/g.9608  ORF Transcript_7093/g.9608 Transcript_7093/m.9608 type:complete len:377 (+) Transcript_7093:70-1200(+)